MKYHLQNIILGLFVFVCSNTFSQEYTDAEIKAAYIYKFSQNIKWPNEESIKKFIIGVYGVDSNLISTLNVFTKSRQIKNKEVGLIRFSNIEEISINTPQILVITNDKKSDIKELYTQLFGKNILFVSDNCNKQVYIMLNLLSLPEDKISFEVNKKTIEEQGLEVLPDLLLLGGTELDLKNLYKLQEVELEEERNRIRSQLRKIKEQQDQIDKQYKTVENQNKKIYDQKLAIEIKKEQLNKQQTMLSDLLEKVEMQNNNLLKKENILKQQQNEIAVQEKSISDQKVELIDGEIELAEQKKKIAEGLKNLSEVEGKLAVQKKFMILMIVVITLVISFAFYILLSFREKLKINKKLKKLNTALEESHIETQQLNEELAATNEELMATNDHLFNQKEELESTINKLKETQMQLIQSEKMASAGILTAGIAHEINNPLNFIQGGTFAVEEYIENEAKKHKKPLEPLFNNIKTGITRATNIINSLNHFSRQSEKNNEVCDLHSVIDNCLVMLNNQLKNKVKVTKSYTSSEHIIIGNEGKLHQVFLNILRNAEQAISEKGEITITTDLLKGIIKTIITDTGSGISKDNINRVMDPFFTTKDPGKGTGLGLSIAYNIVQEHKGIITFTSEEGKGTTTTISFPVE